MTAYYMSNTETTPESTAEESRTHRSSTAVRRPNHPSPSVFAPAYSSAGGRHGSGSYGSTPNYSNPTSPIEIHKGEFGYSSLGSPEKTIFGAASSLLSGATMTAGKSPKLRRGSLMIGGKGGMGPAARRRCLFVTIVAVVCLWYVLVPALVRWTNRPAKIVVGEPLHDGHLVEKLSAAEKKLAAQAKALAEDQTVIAAKEKKIADLEKLLDNVRLKTASTDAASVIPAVPDNSVKVKNPADIDPKSPGVFREKLKTLPASSAWCYGKTLKERICKFKNLYFDPAKKTYFIIVTEDSVLQNFVDSDHSLVDMSSIEEHNAFFFTVQHVAPEVYTNLEVETVSKLTFIFSRFHVGNIMHSLHDDSIGLYHNIRQFAPPDTTGTKPPYAAFTMDHYVQLDEGHWEYDYGHIFQLFSDHPLRLRIKMEEPKMPVTRFEDAVVGQNKIGTWYQYGFISPQGAIADKKVDGYHVRQLSNYIAHRLGVKAAHKAEPDLIVIFSRKSNRLLVNEKELAEKLSAEFKLETIFVRMEDQVFKEQISILQRTKIAIGMHGSILIMGMFLPPGSVLIELYPFAVPSENYTPYRTMCRLPGMNIVYRAWENKHEKNNIMHPDNDELHGGLRHLPENEQNKIMGTQTVPPHTCCTNPYWLFRIYQDTIVEPSEVIKIAHDALDESKRLNLAENVFVAAAPPGVVDHRSITCTTLYNKDKDDEITGVRLQWDSPWNGVAVDQYSVWEHITYKEYKTKDRELVMQSEKFTPGVTLQIWIRTIVQGKTGTYSEKFLCELKKRQA